MRVVPPDLVFFLADEGARCVRGTGWARLAPHLEGGLEPRRLAAAAGLTEEEVRFALAVLARHGLLAGGDREPVPERPASEAGARSGSRLRTREPAAGNAALVVHGEAPALSAAIARLAPRLDGVAADPVRVLAVEDYLDPQLQRLAAEIPDDRLRLPVKAGGERPWVGPLFGGGGEACPMCLATALQRSRPVVALYYRLRSARPRPGADEPLPYGTRLEGVEPSVSAARAEWVAAQVRRLLAEGSLPDTLWVLDPATGEATPHRLRREADCPACGQGPASGGPFALRPRPIAHRGGGFRSEAPAETRRHLAALVDPLTGPVRAVRLHELGPDGAPRVAVAAYPHPLPPSGWRQLRERPRVAAAGKGATAEEALVGAIAEAVERAAGVFRGDEPRRQATAEELGDEAVLPGDVLLYSERQLARGEARGERWTPAAPTEWTAVHSLTDGRRRWLPTALAYHAYRPAAGCWSHPADSNGCAAGRCVEEAILQGLLELVERDAVALWWYNGLTRRRLDPATDGRAESLGSLCRTRGRDLLLLDLTSDLGLPVAAAVALPGEAEGRPLLGFGAHLDPAFALGRALTELAQFLPRTDGTGVADRRAAARAPAWLVAARDAPWAEDGLPAGPACDDFSQALGHVLDRLAGAGLEAWALDQTRAPSPLAVVRVVVPGLRPWTRRLAPGRLYDVPVAMGWRAAPRAEEEMERRPLYV